MRHLMALTVITALALTALIVSRAQTTRVEAVSPVSMHIDCDQAAAGIQDTCNLPGGTTSLTVDMIVVNNTTSPITVGAIQGGATSQPQQMLNPTAPPAFDFTGVGSSGRWNCTLFIPYTDTNPDPGVASSMLGCFSNGGGPTVLPGASIRYATQAYATSAGTGTITPGGVVAGNNDANPLIDCNPTIDIGGDCFGATVTIAPDPPCDGVCPTATYTSTSTPEPTFTPTRTPCTGTCPTTRDFIVEIDCDQAAEGTQRDCALPAGSTELRVNIMLVNPNSSSMEITTIILGTRSQPQTVVNPTAPPVLDLAGALSVGSWDCALITPVIDTNPDPAIADSRIDCLKEPGQNPVIPAQGAIRLATASFATTNGIGTIAPFNVAVADHDFVAKLDCPGVRITIGTCTGASIHIGSTEPSSVTDTPTATSTPTRTPTTTPTPTATPTPRGTKASNREVIVRQRDGYGTITIEVYKPDLRCDGVDSTQVVITRRREDGSLAAGDEALVGMSRGTFKVLSKTSEPGPLRYDERGELRLRAYPKNTGHGYWFLLLHYKNWGERGGHHSFPCPFSDDRTYTVSGEIWNDRNADGAQGDREKPLSAFGIKIMCAACWYFFSTPWHVQKTDASGQYEWLGLDKGGYAQSAPWTMCLDDKDARRWTIVSVNGSPIPPNACVTVQIAEPGNQTFSLGVARR